MQGLSPASPFLLVFLLEVRVGRARRRQVVAGNRAVGGAGAAGVGQVGVVGARQVDDGRILVRAGEGVRRSGAEAGIGDRHWVTPLSVGCQLSPING